MTLSMMPDVNSANTLAQAPRGYCRQKQGIAASVAL
jgi:hypothetical protein